MTHSTSATHRAAVLGDPIEHSLSPLLHNAGYEAAGLTNWHYGRHQCPEGQLAELVRSLPADYRGFSVTMPGKIEALNFATTVTPRARIVGSANTLVRLTPGDPASAWRADNTDVDGLVGALYEALRPQAAPAFLEGLVAAASAFATGGSTDGSGSEQARSEVMTDGPALASRAVIVGNGGTARPAIVALAAVGAREITVVSRSRERAEYLRPIADELEVEFAWCGFEDAAAACAAADVTISTIPAAAAEPWVDALSRSRALIDVIYSPWPTPLITHVVASGCACVGGLTMLWYQALSQFAQFTGHAVIPAAEMRAALEAHTGIPLGALSADQLG